MKNVLITGPPGVGKTTLVKKIVNKLNMLQTDFTGFYTEEVKSNNRRLGFDIVTLDGQRAKLARKSLNDTPSKMPTVGPYSVYLEEFEKLVLPVLEKPTKLIIIDEIGKIELFSIKFKDAVIRTIENKNIRVIATVPFKHGSGVVQNIKDDKNSKLIIVSSSNRDQLLDEIVNLIPK